MKSNFFLLSVIMILGSPSMAGETLLPLFETYSQIQSALASDQFKEAKTGVASLGKAANSVSAKDLDAEAKQVWSSQIKNLTAAIEAGTLAKNMDTLRIQFEHISNVIIALNKQVHQKGFTEYRCPMAFDNKGANWLQKESTTANPYYGSAMLRCGFPVGKQKHAGHKH